MRFHPPRQDALRPPSEAAGSGRDAELVRGEASLPEHSVDVGPAPEEDRVAGEKGVEGLPLAIAGDGGGRDPVGHELAGEVETSGRLLAVDPHRVGLVDPAHDAADDRDPLGHDLAPGAPDELGGVDGSPLVVRALEDESVARPGLLLHLERHAGQLVPRRGRGVEAALGELVLPVEEEARVRDPRDAPDPEPPGRGVEGALEERVPRVVRVEAIRHILDPALLSELGRPDDVARDEVDLALPGLELLDELTAVGVVLPVHHAPGHADAVPMRLVEPVEERLHDPGVIGPRGEHDLRQAALGILFTGASRHRREAHREDEQDRKPAGRGQRVGRSHGGSSLGDGGRPARSGSDGPFYRRPRYRNLTSSRFRQQDGRPE
jgi:hypothetical protein